VTVNILQSEQFSVALGDSVTLCPLPLAHGQAAAATGQHDWRALWEWLIDRREIVTRENHYQQYRENRSAHVAMIGALF